MALAAELTAPVRFTDVAARLKEMQADDLAATNDVIIDHLSSNIELIPEVARHLIVAGGKRLRPLICLAAADICGASGPRPLFLAGAVELIHAATLLHDDVVDDLGACHQEPSRAHRTRRRGDHGAAALTGQQLGEVVVEQRVGTRGSRRPDRSPPSVRCRRRW